MIFFKKKSSRILKREHNICISQNLGQVNILVFWEIVEKGNIFLLDLEYNESKKYSEDQQKLFEEKWLELSDEYFKLKNDDKSKVYLRKRSEELYLYNKIRLYAECLNLLIWASETIKLMDLVSGANIVLQTYELALSIEPRTKIQNSKPLHFNIKVMNDVLMSLNTKYNLKFNEKKKIIDQEVINFYDLVAQVEDVLGRSIGDISKMSVKQWLSYAASAKHKIHASKKKALNGR